MMALEQHLIFAEQGEALFTSGAFADALSAFQKAVRLKPNYYQGWIYLGKVQFHHGDFTEAITSVEQAEKCDPYRQDFQHIQQAIQAQAYDQASDIARNMLRQYPGHPRAIFTLSHLLAMRGAHEDRVTLLQQGLEQSPANLILRAMLITALEDCGEFEAAILTARQLVETEGSFSNLWTLMRTLLRHGFNEDTLEIAEKAYPLCGDDKAKRSEVDLLRGQALKILGRRAECIQAFKSCLENKPQSGTPWWALADMKDHHFSGNDKRKMETVLANLGIPVDQRSQANFALGKAYELDGDLNRAMDYYEKANALSKARFFNAQRYATATEELTCTFTSDVLSRQADPHNNTATPIFIIGMPRSGSTLIEQILASHSQIEGTIEMLVLPSVKRRAHIDCETRFAGPYLEKMDQFKTIDLHKFGQTYLEKSTIFRKESKSYFIDKLPYNFEHIGLIHKILPHALIIDARRNPMDCGFSLFKQYFSAGANYSYDLKNIGAYYNGYLKIMDHWNKVLPGKILCVQYEDMVLNTEQEIRKILDYIGVGFEESCLEFYKNKRSVRTASSEQVRQPIYTKSIGAWHSVRDKLEPLRESLGKTTLSRFQVLSR